MSTTPEIPASTTEDSDSIEGHKSPPDPHHIAPVKPALITKKHHNSPKKKKGGLKWDEAKIEEHDKLRGTRMKIEEPNTPYHHNYDSGSETDGSHSQFKEQALSWDHLENKLAGVAAARDAYPSSPSSHAYDSATEEERQQEMKAIQFKEHRKRHYNEMELVRKFRQQHPDPSDEEDESDNDADDET